MEPTLCETCKTPLSVEHIIIHCPNFNQQRNEHNIRPNLKEALENDEHKTENLLKFLKDTGLLYKI